MAVARLHCARAGATGIYLLERIVFSIIQAAGWPIGLLLATSVVALALVIDRLMALRRSRVFPAGLLNRVLVEYNQHGYPAEALRALASGSPLGRVLSAGIRQRNATRSAMREAIEEEGRAVALDLGRFVGALGTIAAVAPLMGLFGTVIGMIEIFGSQSPTGANPQQLAHGISVALYNTAFGLIVAIPALIFSRWFRGTIESHVLELERQSARLVNVLQVDRRGRSTEIMGIVPSAGTGAREGA